MTLTAQPVDELLLKQLRRPYVAAEYLQQVIDGPDLNELRQAQALIAQALIDKQSG